MDLVLDKSFILAHIFDISSIVTVCFITFMIILIVTKTPNSMKSYKTYLLPYACHCLCLEAACGIYAPSALHPYMYYYPLGIAKYLPQNVSLLILGFSFYSAMSLYDCIVAMVLERYFVMKRPTGAQSKVPFRVFCFLSATSCGYLVFMVIATFYTPLRSYFLTFPEENYQIIHSIFVDFDPSIPPESILIFRNTPANTLSGNILFVSGFLSLRITLTLVVLIFTVIATRKLNPQMSPNLQRQHRTLLSMTALQFAGIIGFILLPLIIIMYVSIYITEPNSAISYTVAVVACFGFYDTLITITYIKPYRNGLIAFLKKLFRKQIIKSNNYVGILPQIK